MNRLTVRYSGIHVGYKNKYNNSVLCSEMTVPQIRECMEKLAAYEDTGLEPEEVKQLNASDVSKEESSIKYYNEMRKYRDELKYYKKLEEQGLLIKLPCKLGTKLFIIQTELWADGKNTRREKCIIESEFTDWNILHVVDNWGKTVFLTREEAEKKLNKEE